VGKECEEQWGQHRKKEKNTRETEKKKKSYILYGGVLNSLERGETQEKETILRQEKNINYKT